MVIATTIVADARFACCAHTSGAGRRSILDFAAQLDGSSAGRNGDWRAMLPRRCAMTRSRAGNSRSEVQSWATRAGAPGLPRTGDDACRGGVLDV